MCENLKFVLRVGLFFPVWFRKKKVLSQKRKRFYVEVAFEVSQRFKLVQRQTNDGIRFAFFEKSQGSCLHFAFLNPKKCLLFTQKVFWLSVKVVAGKIRKKLNTHFCATNFTFGGK